ncbi:MAG: type II secretion system minor pseudopilin GspH [Gammaproteobacteria bacterium]|nr:type II secretion system minor pseudopilin GspH [Gammaproteobacteria bacterium]
MTSTLWGVMGRKAAKEWMPISATGKNNAWSRARGFTIIEILVVVVVIGVMVSIFTLSVGSFADDQGAEDMRRLEALIELASEEAAMQGREIGLTFYQHGYEFAVLGFLTDAEGRPYTQWSVMEQDRIFRPRNLGEDIAVDLELNEDEMVLLYERDTREEYEPQIFILSSGEIEPPFMARLRPAFENTGLTLTAETDGTLTIDNENVDD